MYKNAVQARNRAIRAPETDIPESPSRENLEPKLVKSSIASVNRVLRTFPKNFHSAEPWAAWWRRIRRLSMGILIATFSFFGIGIWGSSSAQAQVQIGDFVWLDEDGDGIQEVGESGINSVIVDLYLDDTDCTGIREGNKDATFTTTNSPTDGAPGYYEFTNVPIGTHCVVLNRDNWDGTSGAPNGTLVGKIATTAIAGSDDVLDSDSSNTHKVLVTVAADDPTIDFGLVTPPSITPSDCYVIADAGDLLGRIDTASGRVDVIGRVNPPNGENLAMTTGLEILNVAGEKGTTPFITIDPANASTTIINPDNGLFDVDALAVDSATGEIYAVENSGILNLPAKPWPGRVWLVDRATGNATLVVTLNWPSPNPLKTALDPHIDGMALDPATGVLYGIYSAYGQIRSYLVTVDLTNGDLTFIGDRSSDPGWTGAGDIEDLSFASDGRLYAVTGDQGWLDETGFGNAGDYQGLITLDAATAQYTKIGDYGDPFEGTNWDMEALACTVANPTTATAVVPTLQQWALILLVVLIGVTSSWKLRRHKGKGGRP